MATKKFQPGEDIGLGDRVKDIITGFQGIVVADTVWLLNCRRIHVQAEMVDSAGKPPDLVTFDVQQLVVVKKNAVRGVGEAEAVEVTGGPTPTVGDPTRVLR